MGTGFREGLNVVRDMALILDIYDAVAAPVLRSAGCVHVPSSRWFLTRPGVPWRYPLDEERRYMNTIADEMIALGWTKAARVARIRFSSRAHALTLLPKAALAKKWQGVKNLAEHVVK